MLLRLRCFLLEYVCTDFADSINVSVLNLSTVMLKKKKHGKDVRQEETWTHIDISAPAPSEVTSVVMALERDHLIASVASFVLLYSKLKS